MNKNESIFFIIVVIAYLICAFALHMDMEINILLAGGILIALIILFFVKYVPKVENKYLFKILMVLIVIFTAMYFISSYFEIVYHKPFIIASYWTWIADVIAIIGIILLGRNKND